VNGPSMLEIAFRNLEMRSRHPNDAEVQRVADSVDRWLDEWAAFNRLPWYQQLWRTFRGRLPEYRSPLR
jgi:hypothetical protein